MKNISFSHILLTTFVSSLILLVNTVQAQSNRTDVIVNDTTVISIIGKDIVIINDGERKHWSVEDRYTEYDDNYDTPYYDENGKEKKRKPTYKTNTQVRFIAFDLGVTNYFDRYAGTFGYEAAPSELEVKPFRIGSHVALHFFPTTVRLIGNYSVNLETAITIDYTQYYFSKNIILQPGQPEMTLDTADTNFSTNKLETRYFEIPLLINFRTHPVRKKGVGISAGVFAGARIFSKTKQENSSGKVKLKDPFNTSDMRYGFIIRMDISWLRLYGKFAMTPVYKKGQGPQMSSFNFGARLFEF